MPQVLSLATAWVPPDQFDAILGHTAELQQLLSALRGTLSVTVWADADLPERYGLLVHYADEDAAEASLETVSESPIFDQLLRSSPSIPDIIRAAVWKEARFEPCRIEVGGYMSSSERNAEPGNVQELLHEMYDIFETLTVLDGFMGYAIAQNTTLREQIIGLVLWANRKGFEASLPKRTLYEVKLWERIR